MVATPVPRAIRCSKSEVNAYHQALSASAAATLGTEFQIRAVNMTGDWTKAGSRSALPARIPFSLVSGVVTIVAGRTQQNYVLSLPPLPGVETTLGWWLSWFEEWETVTDSRSEVTLRSSSLNFYWSSRHAVAPEGLAFRAEWGPFDSGIVQNGHAAHPHWHAHLDAICAGPKGSGDVSVVNLHGFHLPMGGWTHSTVEPAACWQFAPPDSDPSILHDWAVRTIRYFQSQLGEEEIAQN